MDITSGETGRTLKRIEDKLDALATEVQAFKVSSATLSLRVSNVEADVTSLSSDVKSISSKAAAISGGISVAAFIASWFRGH